MYDYHKGEFGLTESPVHRIDYDKMLKDKQKRARDRMKQYSLGAVICLTDPNVAYCTNIPPSPTAGLGGNGYAILPYNGDPIGFQEAGAAFHLKNGLPRTRIELGIPAWGGPYEGSTDAAQDYLVMCFAEQVHSVLKELNLHKEKIGLDVDIPHIASQLQKQGLNISLEGGKALIEARSVKTPEEVECVRALASVIDGCFATMAATARAGVRERDCWARCVSYVIEQGLIVAGGDVESGPHTWPKDSSHVFSDYRLRPGDVTCPDFWGFCFFGYRSCYYRAFSIGRASKEVREAYDRAYQWLKEAERVLKPGVTTKDVVEKWPDEIELWSRRPPFIRNERDALGTFYQNMGHSIGLQLYVEKPFFWRPTSLRWPQTIEAGMTIALETLDGTPDNRLGVRIEDMIVITDTGYEVISRWPAEEITELPLWR